MYKQPESVLDVILSMSHGRLLPPSNIKVEKMVQGLESISRAAKPRAIITSDDAVRIFSLSLPYDDPKSAGCGKPKRPSAIAVAREYGVSEKTIRDIWSGRTW